MNKKCASCKEIKPDFSFSKSSYTKSGLATYCKLCDSKRDKIARERRKNNPPTIKRDSKKCFKCNTIKPIGQFSKKTNSHDGHNTYCRPCWTKITIAAQKRMVDKRKI